MSYEDRPRSPDEYFTLLKSIRGQMIEQVFYRDLCYDDEDSKTVFWDHGLLHQPTMGVEFNVNGRSFSFIWGQSGSDFGLQYFAGELTETVRNTPQCWEVTDHQAWQPFTSQPIQDFALWIDTHTNLVTAIELTTHEEQTVWIVNADTDTEHRLLVGTDDLVVIFAEEVVTATFDSSLIRQVPNREDANRS
ncbi:hypothetical protein SAMN05216298_2226 [Glycomyces sambucus]|uniref:Uncharacterized protein n=1 Tax=Glycomyces sambucus TaxID=380244 RepID=A0A1G9GIT2_9ACTN|nr:hypothetical protein [Glycomyces sambucus]SDL00512.1 hypothetical protein SAMN05216298_2226 [Glycomyces sambucus]